MGYIKRHSSPPRLPLPSCLPGPRSTVLTPDPASPSSGETHAPARTENDVLRHLEKLQHTLERLMRENRAYMERAAADSRKEEAEG